MLEVNLQDNRLLAVLPAEDRQRLRPSLKPVALEFGETLYRPGEELRHVYFPRDAVIAKLYLSANGDTASLGLVGCEGIVGMSSFLGGIEAATEARVIGAGGALRLDTAVLEREFETCDAFQKILLAFTQAFIAQTGQIAVCNRHHSVDQQLCFWLLLYFDRAPSRNCTSPRRCSPACSACAARA